MKRIYLLIGAFALLACKKDETVKKESKISEAISTVSNAGKLASSMDELQASMQKLKSTPVTTNEQLKSAIPETLMNLPRKEFTIGPLSAMQISSAEAKYADDNRSISYTIMDGAGESGSGMMSILMLSLKADSEKETESGFEKTMIIKGNKALVSQKNVGERTNSSMKFVQNNRYMIDLSGNNFTLDELTKVLNEIQFDKLP